MFVTIESGMTLLVIQLVRAALNALAALPGQLPWVFHALYCCTVIGQMINVIIRYLHLYFFCLTEKIYLDRASH